MKLANSLKLFVIILTFCHWHAQASNYRELPLDTDCISPPLGARENKFIALSSKRASTKVLKPCPQLVQYDDYAKDLKDIISSCQPFNMPRLDSLGGTSLLFYALKQATAWPLWQMLYNFYKTLDQEDLDELAVVNSCKHRKSLLRKAVEMKKFPHVQILLFFNAREIDGNKRLFRYAIKKNYFSIAALFAIYNGTLCTKYPVFRELYEMNREDERLVLMLVYQLEAKSWDGKQALDCVCEHYSKELEEYKKGPTFK